jgi:predicted nucleotidyltransferase
MRLTPDQITIIRDTTQRVAGLGATVSLYGSRLDDSKFGGDVDLLIESTPVVTLLQRASIKTSLEQQLNLPVDVLVASASISSPFVNLARVQAQRL